MPIWHSAFPAHLPTGRDDGLHEHLRVPEVRLEEEQLAPGLEQAVQRPQVLPVPVVADDRGADDVVEALRREVFREVADVCDLDVRQPAGVELLGEPLVEDDRRDRALASERRREVLRPQTAARTELEDALTRQDVERVAHRQRTPSQLRRGGRRVAAPVALARLLHLAEVGFEGLVRHRSPAAASSARMSSSDTSGSQLG